MSTDTCAGCTSPLVVVEVCRHLTNGIPGDVFFELRTARSLSRHGCVDADCPRLKVCSACWHDLDPVHPQRELPGGTAAYVRAVLKRAAELSPEQIQLLRDNLPPVKGATK